MIYDLRNHVVGLEACRMFAKFFRVVATDTGEEITCFHADDAAGTYRMYLADEFGNFYLRHAITKSRLVWVGDSDSHADSINYFADGTSDRNHLETAWEEHRRPLRIEIKPDLPPMQRAIAEEFARVRYLSPRG